MLERIAAMEPVTLQGYATQLLTLREAWKDMLPDGRKVEDMDWPEGALFVALGHAARFMGDDR
jgi:hypothetical protein